MAEDNIHGEVQQYLTFRLAEEIFGINVLQVKEILDLPQVTKVPRTPDFMLGVINLRGSVVPVIDMRNKFGLDAADMTRDTCVIVLEIEGRDENLVVGAQADSVLEVVDLAESEVEPAPSIGTSLDIEFIRGMGKVGDDFVILLNLSKIFSGDEFAVLQQAEDINVEKVAVGE